MRMIYVFGFGMVSAILVGAVALAGEPTGLAHDPFARPPSAATTETRVLVQADGSVLPLDLRATMVGTANGLANVGGRVIRPGEEVRGYTLLRVFEDKAVFSRDGNRLTVYVKPHLVKDNDDH